MKSQQSSSAYAEAQCPTLALTRPEILASVKSIFSDELKCYGRVLLKRLRERAAARLAEARGLPAESVDPETLPRLNPKHLRKLCETCRQMKVLPEDRREFSVILVDQPCTFLDDSSPVDPYSEEFWNVFASYLDSLAADEMSLPGGRYACACYLAGKRLPFLHNFSLGKVCQIVQIATSQRRLLGYKNGRLVPYQYSEGWVKEQFASAQASTGQEAHPVVSWDDARTFMHQLLTLHQQGETGGIVLSSLKHLFRMHFGRELSETALGHARLLDLMHDSRLSDICTLHTQRNSQTLVKATESSAPSLSPAVPPGRWAINVPTIAVPVLALISASKNPSEPRSVSPGSSPRSLPSSGDELHACSSGSFTTESTTDGSLDSASSSDIDDFDTLGCDEFDESAGLWAIGIKNTFINVRVKETERFTAPSKQRRSSLPACISIQAVH